MKIRLINTLIIILCGISLSAQAERDPLHHFSYFDFGSVSYTEEQPLGADTLEGSGYTFRFGKNFGRLFHLRVEATDIDYKSYDLDKKSTEVGLGVSIISNTKHDLYFVVSGLSSQIKGNDYDTVEALSQPAGFTLPSRQKNTTFYNGLFGYKYNLRPGIQTSFEVKAMVPDDSDNLTNSGGSDINTRFEIGAKIHPPTNDRISLGVRVAVETLKYHFSYDEAKSKDTTFFLVVHY